MRLGTLDWTPALDSPDLLAAPVLQNLRDAVGRGEESTARAVLVTAIDPGLADTAAMTESPAEPRTPRRALIAALVAEMDV